MELNFLYLACTIPAIMLYGVAKSGLGGSMALISIPLMTVVMTLSQALAIIPVSYTHLTLPTNRCV